MMQRSYHTKLAEERAHLVQQRDVVEVSCLRSLVGKLASPDSLRQSSSSSMSGRKRRVCSRCA